MLAPVGPLLPSHAIFSLKLTMIKALHFISKSEPKLMPLASHETT
jgi:hypothetical protein